VNLSSSAQRLLGRTRDAVDRFAFAPASAAPLAALRAGLAAVLLAQAASVAPAFLDFYSSRGILQDPVRGAFSDRGPLCLTWLVDAFSRIGAGETPVLAGVAIVYVLALLALLVGLGTRAAAAIAWLVHLMLMTTAHGTTYGLDQFALTLLFHLVWMPAGAAFSLDRRLGRAPADPSPMARFALRVLQLNLCIVYLISGISKAMGPQWWNGDAVWRSLMLPEFEQLDFSWLANHPWAPKAAGWAVLLVESGYPIFIWPRLTRRIWLAAAVALHLGIALFMGLHLFGAIMVVFNVAAFGAPATPAPGSAVARRWALRLLASLGAIVLAAELLAMVRAAAEKDNTTVPITDVTLVERPSPE
jgi:Vitamin K-dependent gamma-carboxylase